MVTAHNLSKLCSATLKNGVYYTCSVLFSKRSLKNEIYYMCSVLFLVSWLKE